MIMIRTLFFLTLLAFLYAHLTFAHECSVCNNEINDWAIYCENVHSAPLCKDCRAGWSQCPTCWASYISNEEELIALIHQKASETLDDGFFVRLFLHHRSYILPILLGDADFILDSDFASQIASRVAQSQGEEKALSEDYESADDKLDIALIELLALDPEARLKALLTKVQPQEIQESALFLVDSMGPQFFDDYRYMLTLFVAYEFDLRQLIQHAFPVEWLKWAGFSFGELVEDGATSSQLERAGFGVEDVREYINPQKFSAFESDVVWQIRKYPHLLGIDKNGLGFEYRFAFEKDHEQNVEEIRSQKELSDLSALKEFAPVKRALREVTNPAVNSIIGLRESGYTLKAIVDAGTNINFLIVAGYSACKLANVDFSADVLYRRGFDFVSLVLSR